MGKRNVQKKANPLLDTKRAQLLAEWDQLIIVDPDAIRRPQVLHELAGEHEVRLPVRGIFVVLVAKPRQEIVEQRPERSIRKAAVIPVVKMLRQWKSRVGDSLPDRGFRLNRLARHRLPVPAEP